MHMVNVGLLLLRQGQCLGLAPRFAVPPVPAASELVSDDDVPIPWLHVSYLPHLFAPEAASLLVIVMMKFPFHVLHSVLLLLHATVMTRFFQTHC
jgi:hypothetical protein